MAAFLVAFDRLVRRQRRMSYRWDFQTRQSSREEVLFSPRDQILAKKSGNERLLKNGRLFSYATRGYLRRRAWRYFRWMGFGRPADYPTAIARAPHDLPRRRFRPRRTHPGQLVAHEHRVSRSDQLEFTPARVNIADGGSLSQLTAAPRFEDLWKSSRLVRVWAITLLKRHHSPAMQQIPVEQLMQLLDNDDEDVQQFGASLINSLAGIDSWPVSTWLRLLETRNLTALATICEVINQRVRPDRLNLEQCVALACARVTPVARLGLSWLRTRSISSDQDRATLANLAAARCEAVAAEIAEFALSILGAPPVYRTDTVVNFFDSLNPEVRRGAWEWLTPQSAGYTDPELWTRLFETPYDDVRLRLVDELRKAHSRPGDFARDSQSKLRSALGLGPFGRSPRRSSQATRASSNLADHCRAARTGRALDVRVSRRNSLRAPGRSAHRLVGDPVRRRSPARAGSHSAESHPGRNHDRSRRPNPPRQVRLRSLPQIRNPQRPLPPHDRAAFVGNDQPSRGPCAVERLRIEKLGTRPGNKSWEGASRFTETLSAALRRG